MKSGIFITLALPWLCLAGIHAQPATEPESIRTRIDAYLKESMENGFSGSVLAAKNGTILLSDGYGWSNQATNRLNDASTVFNIGSLSKQFTAAGIMKLWEEQKLDPSDPIATFFPQVPSDKKDITLHQLLTHSSGISPGTGGFRYHEAGREQFLEEFFHSELLYEPGTRHTYANANYILLAAILEEASGRDYESFLKENFWIPLHMKHTGYKRIDFDPELLAHGYSFHDSEGAWKDWGTTPDHLPREENHWYSIGKGDLYSTVEDLYSWHVALQEDRILSAKSREAMEKAHIPENVEETSFYGYGWAILSSASNQKIVTHNGSNGLYFADMIRNVDDNIVVIALSNKILNQHSQNVAWEIASMLDDGTYTPRTIPKNTYELVFDFMRSNPPEEAARLPQFILDKTGAALEDKAILNRIGYKQIAENRNPDWGIALLELNVRIFPDDGNLWDSLGEGHYLLNNQEKALAAFRKAVNLKPESNCHWCENSSQRMAELLGE